MFYPAIFEQGQDGYIVVTFRDIPEAITQGNNEAEAIDMAQDALMTAFDFYFEDRRTVPAPSKPKLGEHLIEVPPSVTAKILLLNEMIAQKIKPIDLARSMCVKPQEVQRLMNLSHHTKIDTIDVALSALGKHLNIQVI
jgi:antitoxin HicB